MAQVRSSSCSAIAGSGVRDVDSGTASKGWVTEPSREGIVGLETTSWFSDSGRSMQIPFAFNEAITFATVVSRTEIRSAIVRPVVAYRSYFNKPGDKQEQRGK
jgi:hypothetical protein